MMTFDSDIALDCINGYFEWMVDLVCGNRYARGISYRELLYHLHGTEFVWSIPDDVNRAEEGMTLRYRYTVLHGYEEDLLYLDGPCSVLEMMIALAIHCEEGWMDDPTKGDRTSQWFWEMIVSLGLGSMVDERYDRFYVEDVITRFLNRDYEPDGRGGLFTIRHCKRDMRDLAIWHQLCEYINGLI